MKKIIPVLFVTCAFFYACRKDYANEQYTSTGNQSTTADLNVTVTTSISGFVTDENDHPVNGATVSSGGLTTATDSLGYFKISNTTISKLAGTVRVTYPGYFTGDKTFMCGVSKSLFTRIKLMPKTNIGTVNSASGGSATTSDGAIVTLPANAAVVASNSSAYSGGIHIAAHFIDPTDNAAVNLNMPGDLRGVDSSNNIQGLNSFGMLAVELTGDGGQLLQIKSGNEATLSFPIPSSLLSVAPATIPLWSFNDSNGLWKEEGIATKSGNNYIGTVHHFSYWNCDQPFGAGVTITTQIIDSSLHPVANATIEIVGQSGEYTGCHGETDDSGYITGLVPTNSNLQLNIQTTPCYSTVYSKNFSTTTTNLDLGAVGANSGQLSLYTITGTVVDCSNNPVTDGRVVLVSSNNSGNISVPVVNGNFTVSPLSCPGATYSIAAIDNNALSASSLQPLTLSPGANNLPPISVCGTTAGYLRMTVDGVTTATYLEPLDSVNVYEVTEPVINGYWFQINCGPLNDPGKGLLFMNRMYTSPTNQPPFYVGPISTAGIQYTLTDSIPINITQNGAVGDYVIGNFTTTMLSSSDNNTHTVSMAFKLKRLDR